jgi:cell division protein FtsQ
MMPANRRIDRDRRSGAPDVLDVAPGGGPRSARPLLKKPETPLARAFGVVRLALGLCLVVLLSWAVAWSARRYVKSTPRFGVKEIVVLGATKRTSDEIAREAGISVGQNVFSLDLDEARAKVMADARVAEVTLSRRLPSTVVIQITEREAAAVVPLGETYLATRDGDVFKRMEGGEGADLPIVTGITADAVAEDREGTRRTIKRAIDLATDYERGPLATRVPLEEVHVASDGTFSLVVGKSGVNVVLGEPPFHRKLAQAARVFGELERRGAKAHTIMLDNDARPERVVVRMR